MFIDTSTHSLYKNDDFIHDPFIEKAQGEIRDTRSTGDPFYTANTWTYVTRKNVHKKQTNVYRQTRKQSHHKKRQTFVRRAHSLIHIPHYWKCRVLNIRMSDPAENRWSIACQTGPGQIILDGKRDRSCVCVRVFGMDMDGVVNWIFIVNEACAFQFCGFASSANYYDWEYCLMRARFWNGVFGVGLEFDRFWEIVRWWFLSWGRVVCVDGFVLCGALKM